MSNVIKSGFVAFADDHRIIIDSNSRFREKQTGKIIRSIEEQQEDREIEGLELEDILTDEAFKDPAFEEKKAFADIIIQDAKVQADKLLEEARKEAAHILEQAKTEGYQAGYSEGEQKARQEMASAMAEKQKVLSQEYERLKKQQLADKELFLQEAEPKMAEIAGELITHLTGIVVEDQQEVMIYMIDRAMRDIEDSSNFVIKVSEEDYAWVSSHKEQIYGASNPSISIEIFADAKLGRNQCLIEMDNGIVNCSLDEQMKNLVTDIKLLASVK